MQPVLYIRKPGDDNEQAIRFPDDDPFFSEVSNLIDIIEDIEEDPDAAQILSTYEGRPSPVELETTLILWNTADAVRTYELTWAIREASEQARAAKLRASAEAAKVQKTEKV